MSDIKKSSLEINQRNLIASSTNSTENSYNEPAVYYPNDNGFNNNSHEKKSRSESIASLSKKSIDQVRKSLQGDQSYNDTDLNDKQYSVHQIYGDLNSEEIELQRIATRRSILGEIEHKIADEVNNEELNEKELDDGVIEDQVLPVTQHGEDFIKIDPELITWNGTEDPEDPRNWSASLKIFLLGFVSLYALVAPMSSSILSPAMSEISVAFGITSEVVQAMVVSIQILAWAFGPLIIAPLSEYDNIGRKLVLDVSCWMSLFFNLGCAFSQNTAQMMVCRFIGGLFGCVPMNVCAGVISDLFDANLRNAALAGYSLVPLLGPVIGLGSFMAFTYGFMYLLIVTFPQIFEKQYGFSKSITGLMYLPMGCGFILGVVFWTFMVGRVYKKLTIANGGVAKPEFRLPCLIACAVFIPVGLIWFGWSAQKELHWIMPGIGSAIFAFGLVCVFQTIQNYLIDMNVRFAASSVAAAALFRSLFGYTFPLFARKMYSALGYGWANTMCAFIGILLGVPFPIFCYLYGEKLRESYNRKFEIKQQRRDQKNLERLKRKNGDDSCMV